MANDDWMTPPEWIERVCRAMGCIELDPCTTPEINLQRVHATRIHTPDDDGLVREWAPGPVWMNPPYSRAGKWADRFIEQAIVGTALFNADTSTKWFHDMMSACDAMFLPEGRISFLNPETGQPSSGNRMGQVFFFKGVDGFAGNIAREFQDGRLIYL